MPVSKKRKKEGKPVRRQQPAAADVAEHPHGPEAKPTAQTQLGRPKNPFVAQQQAKRGAQRGR